MKILAGKYKGKALKIFSNASVRPTCGIVKEAVFNICAAYIESAHFLDLFAGVGSMGFEALSRGAASVTFVDASSHSVRLIRANHQRIDPYAPISVLKQDVCLSLPKLAKKGHVFDLIYMDPPYHLEDRYLSAVLQGIVRGGLLHEEGLLFLENASAEPLCVHGLQLRHRRKLGGTFLSEYVREVTHSE